MLPGTLQRFCPPLYPEGKCCDSLDRMGNLVCSALPGVWMAVRGGGQEWVISRRISSTQLESVERLTSPVWVRLSLGSLFLEPAVLEP